MPKSSQIDKIAAEIYRRLVENKIMSENVAVARRGRPPKKNAESEDIRAMLIRSGTVALTENSFATVGIDGILRSVGVPKGSFYYYFESKEQFGLAVLDSYAGYFAHKLSKTMGNKTLQPLERIIAFRDSAKEGMARYDYKRGCIVGNLAQEIGVLPEVFRDRLKSILDTWQAIARDCLNDAIADNTVNASANTTELAEYFWTGWEGAVMRAKLLASPEPLDVFIKHFLAGLPR